MISASNSTAGRWAVLAFGALALGACAAVTGLGDYSIGPGAPDDATASSPDGMDDEASASMDATGDGPAPEGAGPDATVLEAETADDAETDATASPTDARGDAVEDAVAPGDAQAAEGGCTTCAGACVDTSSDKANCGRCGNVCKADGGVAACCASACLDTSTNVASCGACGHACAPVNVNHAQCSGSVCTYDSCQTGFADCDGNKANGCEANLAADKNNCGKCGTVCSTGLCGTSIADWGTSSSLWKANGSATIGTGQLGSQAAILTTATSSLAGSINYVNPIVTDSFTATFSAYLGMGGGADGMGFMWQTQGAAAVGANGGCLGICGLPGYGVELDTYNNNTCGDTNTNHVAVDALLGCVGGSFPNHIMANQNLPVLDNASHSVVVEMTNGLVSVSVDGTSLLTGVALPGFVLGTPYYFGFGGGTGGAADRHEVAAASIAFPTPRCL